MSHKLSSAMVALLGPRNPRSHPVYSTNSAHAVLYAAVDPVQVELRRRCRCTHISAISFSGGKRIIRQKTLHLSKLRADRYSRGYMSAHYSHTGTHFLSLIMVLSRDHLEKSKGFGSLHKKDFNFASQKVIG